MEQMVLRRIVSSFVVFDLCVLARSGGDTQYANDQSSVEGEQRLGMVFI